jgi:hypothetical protein
MRCFAALALILAFASAAFAELPKVERDFTTVGDGDHTGKTLAALIPPGSVQRIILTHDHGLGSTVAPGVKTEFDPDELLGSAFRSRAKSQRCGLRATESTAAEFLLVTKKGDVFRLEVLCDRLTKKGAVTGLLVYGKGFACRFDASAPPRENKP